MLTLAGLIAIAGVLTDSTATVIGAMIIAPLGTPILGIGLGIVTGHLSLVLRSILWVLIGLVIVVVLGLVFSVFVATPESLATNSQVTRAHVAEPHGPARRARDRLRGRLRDVPQGPQRGAPRAWRSRSRWCRRSAWSACAPVRGCGAMRSAR